MLSDNVPWATVMIGGLVLISAGVGGAVVIWGDDGALTFEKYLDLLKNFAIAVGILGVGRGIVAHGKKTAEAAMLDDNALLAAGPAGDDWRDGESAAYAGGEEALSADSFDEQLAGTGNGRYR